MYPYISISISIAIYMYIWINAIFNFHALRCDRAVQAQPIHLSSLETATISLNRAPACCLVSSTGGGPNIYSYIYIAISQSCSSLLSAVWWGEQHWWCAKHHFLPTLYRLCLEFFSSGWMQNHFVFVFCGAFSLSLKLQNWMLSLCSLLSLVSEGRCRPKWEIEGLPIGTSWWWNVKNAEYLIPTFVMCPKPDISMSTKMLFWYRPSRVSGPVQRRGVSEQTGR